MLNKLHDPHVFLTSNLILKLNLRVIKDFQLSSWPTNEFISGQNVYFAIWNLAKRGQHTVINQMTNSSQNSVWAFQNILFYLYTVWSFTNREVRGSPVFGGYMNRFHTIKRAMALWTTSHYSWMTLGFALKIMNMFMCLNN